MENKKELKILSGIESYGSHHSSNAQVLLKSNLYNELPKEKQDDICMAARTFIEQLRSKIELAHNEEYKQKERQENIEKMKELFHEAGFKLVHANIIPNQYSSDPCYYVDPWLEVITIKGPIIIGWRKRVINIDWSKSDITQKADELFPNEDVTKYDQLIHAWGYEKTVDYLSTLVNI